MNVWGNIVIESCSMGVGLFADKYGSPGLPRVAITFRFLWLEIQVWFMRTASGMAEKGA